VADWVVLEDFEAAAGHSVLRIPAGTIIDDTRDYDVTALRAQGLVAVVWDTDFEAFRAAFLAARSSRERRVEPSLLGALLRTDFGARMVGSATGSTVQTDIAALQASVALLQAAGQSQFVEVGPVDTVAAALEDIAGAAVNVTLPAPGRIYACMAFNCELAAPGAAVGGWAVQIDAVDGTALLRDLTSIAPGIGVVQGVYPVAPAAMLPAGVYAVKGRHYRDSGAQTVRTLLAQLFAHATE
jgi:hypothetical protein